MIQVLQYQNYSDYQIKKNELTFQRFLSQLCAFLVPFPVSGSCMDHSPLQLKSFTILDNHYKLPSSYFRIALIFVSPITIQNYNFARGFVWVWNLVADIEGGTQAEGVWE